MAIIQHLIVDEYGAFIGKHSERLIVFKGDEKRLQAPLLHLESVVIANLGVSISADAVQACTERGIPIYFLNSMGEPYASLYSAGLTGTIATRRAQLEAYRNRRGLDLVIALAMGKIQNQANFLKYMSKYRKESDPALYEELRLCAAEILDERIKLERLTHSPDYKEGRLSVEQLRQPIMGIEGRAARRYWEAIRQTVPEKYGFPGREGRGATDPINAALNYGYGILYGQVERAIVLAGLDPYAGFLHVDRPGKPSLTLDFIEEFRPMVVDRTIIGLANKGVEFSQDGKNLLTAETRRMVAERVLERLDTPIPFEGKRYSIRAIIQMQARHMATYLRGERDTYQPSTLPW
ncbi:MAG: CRISPR-associated endonuclease Cas1 [Thermanaerothrix sp.]|uniref:CRISPR-associated endonuclease Cas1 n=1 Tax=Thermanaerothrix solaris TaxID=3058434 RepID=A0ABU3NL92_9CHLR|nr:CRISPR-associated endonuclease Cas1 [Thermanaerothrix sp. 4228-RoL]MDT8897611.1 CRISPR-associated endonuclease Cas1 [Thermanaerothrix sp. 4228-RoL]